ncbi:MAG: alkaline phosphatase [Pseudomonadales bacterium]|nr:alkaline phosphatase [Pseudomonadales bacterium]MCP5185763.1 alkaline phosphatase [Pseudomonadales bacterium]
MTGMKIRMALVALVALLVAPSTWAGQVVLFLGDGMGVSTITAGRILDGQLKGGSGEDNQLVFDTFPNVALIKTYNTDMQVPDSAGTMSAIITGEKTRFGVLSVSPAVPRGDCAQSLAGALPTLLEQAEDTGYATGVVTTTRITHATPAATYAHVPERDWEDDTHMPAAARDAGCRDIARQLVEFAHGDGIDVILGGGRAAFMPGDQSDPEYPHIKGSRSDGNDLIAAWQQGGKRRAYVWNAEQFRALAGKDQVLGLFEPSHMQWEADRTKDVAGEPSLAEMTGLAIRTLKARSRNFFLLVEGGRIDHGHHAGNAYRALHDVVAFNAAVAVAAEAIDARRGLVLVTADHSHTLTMAGYPPRGNPILGKVPVIPGGGEGGAPTYAYPTLGYANGPGGGKPLDDYADVDTQAGDFRQPATFPMQSETHGGEDVAAFARGRGADLVRGVMEQNQLYDALYRGLFGRTPKR